MDLTPAKHLTSFAIVQVALNEGVIELVSWGLAPNPNGACFELLDKSLSPKAQKAIGNAVQDLSRKEYDFLVGI